ncbi:hypothetical protein [Reichenbachiella versicolor]|uniref:hypothetical protein n=1 Tax=Reichenbachiella versicolor TaxID=1821036 RepID=UPI0013A5443E|nr:hypothetical protein [Reichenbachiella versicolor]
MRQARYSLFLNDSTPKFALASRRTKYGVNKKTNYYRKNYELMTAPKENILKTPVFDSVNFGIDQATLLAREDKRRDAFKLSGEEDPFLSPIDSMLMVSDSTMLPDSTWVVESRVDSTSLDSLTMMALNEPDTVDEGPKYKYRYHTENNFNMEQVYYNKYYGELFIDNRPPPPSPEELAAMQARADSIKQANKKPFFGLFAKANADDLKEDTSEEEFDLDELLEGTEAEDELLEESVETETTEVQEPEIEEEKSVEDKSEEE